MKSWTDIRGSLADYVDANWLRESALKRRLRAETGKMPAANMQISVHQGQQLALLARTVNARIAVEVGIFTEQCGDGAAAPGLLVGFATRFAKQGLFIETAGIGIFDRCRQRTGFQEGIGERFGVCAFDFNDEFDIGHDRRV